MHEACSLWSRSAVVHFQLKCLLFVYWNDFSMQIHYIKMSCCLVAVTHLLFTEPVLISCVDEKISGPSEEYFRFLDILVHFSLTWCNLPLLTLFLKSTWIMHSDWVWHGSIGRPLASLWNNTLKILDMLRQ